MSAKQQRYRRTPKGQATAKKYYTSPKGRAKGLEIAARGRAAVKIACFEHYSKGIIQCACCRVNHIEFLCIDHINRGGCKHRRELGKKGGHHFYRWLQKQNWPEGYRVLCHNCNQSHGIYGYCPHEKEL